MIRRFYRMLIHSLPDYQSFSLVIKFYGNSRYLAFACLERFDILLCYYLLGRCVIFIELAKVQNLI